MLARALELPEATEATPSVETPQASANDSKPPVRIERPYRLGARPIPSGRVQASTHDTELGAWNLGGSSHPELASNRAGYHPATRVILDTQVLSGKKSLGPLSAGAILAQTRSKGYWPFRLCFEEGLRQGNQKSTTTVLRFSIDTRGQVSYARKMKSDASSEVTTCMRQAAYAPKYSPRPPRRVDVELTAQLSRGDVTLPGRDPETAARVDAAALLPALDRLEPRVSRCYAEGLARDAKLWGRIELLVARDESGRVTRTEELGSRFPDAGVMQCVQEVVSEQVLDAGHGPDLVLAWRFGEWTPE
jgi:hypothetical protein